MGKFVSPYASRIWEWMERKGTTSKWRVPLCNCHEEFGMTAGDFDRGLSWLIHFGWVQKVVDNGGMYIERTSK